MKMNRNTKSCLWTGSSLLAAFLLWTLLIMRVDVQAVGPNGTSIGFATFNLWFHSLTGVHLTLYTITDWLGLVPIAVCLCFAVLSVDSNSRIRSLCRRSVARLARRGFFPRLRSGALQMVCEWRRISLERHPSRRLRVDSRCRPGGHHAFRRRREKRFRSHAHPRLEGDCRRCCRTSHEYRARRAARRRDFSRARRPIRRTAFENRLRD